MRLASLQRLNPARNRIQRMLNVRVSLRPIQQQPLPRQQRPRGFRVIIAS